MDSNNFSCLVPLSRSFEGFFGAFVVFESMLFLDSHVSLSLRLIFYSEHMTIPGTENILQSNSCICNKNLSDLAQLDYRIIFQWIDIGVVSKKSVGCQNCQIIECPIIECPIIEYTAYRTPSLICLHSLINHINVLYILLWHRLMPFNF